MQTAEDKRLVEAYQENKKWLYWGPYVSERQWGTVREDYSKHGDAWNFFPFEDAVSRVYRWGEDGIAGICDRWQRLCFAPAFWNGKDSIIKERLFGLTCPQGNHGEDCKELYYYLVNTPSHSYMKYLYKYSQHKYPYQELLFQAQNRNRNQPEFELLDTHLFDANEYFDIFIEYAKNDPEDILIKITAHNKSIKPAELYVIPQLWFRNFWSFGKSDPKPHIQLKDKKNNFGCTEAQHFKLGSLFLYYHANGKEIFTENENNKQKLWNIPNESSYVKDFINDSIVSNQWNHSNHRNTGTKLGIVYHDIIEGGKDKVYEFRLSKKSLLNPFENFETIFENRIHEADTFFDNIIPKTISEDEKNIQKQSYSGMLWAKQYYNIDILDWLKGDPGQPKPPLERYRGRNVAWESLNNNDIISMPDKWEYPWYAAWDLAFHCIPLARLDMNFAKKQLLLLLKEWYMHPNGQIPAYEWNFNDVNPPVHAMATLAVFKIDEKINKKADIVFLKKVFHKLCLNFTWWVNRKDIQGKSVFQGGFLGLDNIGIFDRNNCLPGCHLEQADGTAWMAMYCLNMLEIALIINQYDHAYVDMATKFFEHFAHIAESLNTLHIENKGAWDEEDGFFYDILVEPNGNKIPLKVRSLVGITTLFATLYLPKKLIDNAPEFVTRMTWFDNYLQKQKSYKIVSPCDNGTILLSLVPPKNLEKLLSCVLNEAEFLSDYGIRSLSKIHEQGVYVNIQDQFYGLNYEPAESTTSMFGGNSNWRGPIWLPMNYMIIKSLRMYYEYYGDTFKIQFPTGSKSSYNLNDIANKLTQRLVSIFKKDTNNQRPVHQQHAEIYARQGFKDYILFYEYFHGDSGRGIGASHQTGWTGIITELMNDCLK